LNNTKRLGKYNNVLGNSNNNDNSTSQSDFSELESMYKDSTRNPSIDFSKPLFGNKYTSLQKLLANANKTTERATKFLNKIKSKRLACANRAKSIPENVTIRKEYIRCGKEMCEPEHGPYYYAYWKDPESKKLKKKYIGDHMPKKERLENNSNNNQVL